MKRVVLHRKNALFYRTLNGAQVGDLFMSLIHTCQLCAANSFDYLIELQRHARELAARPSEWMLWNYRDTLGASCGVIMKRICRKGYSAATAREHRDMPVKRASGRRKSRRVFGHPDKAVKNTLRAGLYARVSTNDQQTLPMQNRALREYPARRGWTTTMQVKEGGSGAAQRQMREKLMEGARRRDIDVVLVWRLDRWGRVGCRPARHSPGTGPAPSRI